MLRSLETTLILAFVFVAFGCANPANRVQAGQTAKPSTIRVGQNIEKALVIMKAASEGQPLLALAIDRNDLDIKMWPVRGGVIVATYSKSSKAIVDLALLVLDGKTKGQQMVHEMLRTCVRSPITLVSIDESSS